ncbi:putative ferric-chelate reductase 1 [Holothuria leucospilota]|uniref:Ferric-chelate reductase 1 n=1 Tax=Holothuria leucospilota TaxID=206669 RepID=A0A9Q1BL95_HOLLE|nr:putative ferric-chelate reductase 1 [Holothuria leucospilota]
MKGLYTMVMVIILGFVLIAQVQSDSPTFCDAKWGAFNDTRMCFSHPYDCTEDDRVPCQMTMTVRTSGDGYFTFSLSGRLEANESTGWIALGLSTDRYMGNDDVMMCILESDGNVTLHHRFNVDRTNRPAETTLLDLLHPDPLNSMFDDGVIKCNFIRSTQKIQARDPYYGFDLLIPRTFYLLFGIGPTNSSGFPAKHRTVPYISDSRIDFTRIYRRIRISESLMQAQSPREVEGKIDNTNYKSSAISPTLGYIFIFSLVSLHQVTVKMFL